MQSPLHNMITAVQHTTESIRGLLSTIIPTKPHDNEGGPTRILAVTADRPEHNEAAQISLGLLTLPGIMSWSTRQVVPLLRNQPVLEPKRPGRNRG